MMPKELRVYFQQFLVKKIEELEQELRDIDCGKESEGKMTYKEKLEQNIEKMNKEGGASHQTLEILLLTSIANSLVVIADCLIEKEAKDADNQRTARDGA